MPEDEKQKTLNALEAILDQYASAMTEDLCRLLRYPTILGEPAPLAPFGKDIAAGLSYVLELAASFGFTVQNEEGYVGLVQYGQTERQIGALCHVDVVPAGGHWLHAPFGGELENDIIYGRGAFDDKGPLIAVLYAMRALKEENVPLKNGLCLIVGTDEESGFRCMDYYKKHHQPPLCSIVPDADFPLVYAEKGIVHLQLSMPLGAEGASSGIQLQSLSGGIAANVIPESAEAFLACDQTEQAILEELLHKYEQRRRIKLTREADGLRLVASGRSAHGSLPEEGVNAISILLGFLRGLPLAQNAAEAARIFYMLCGEDTDGRGLRIACADEHGALTMAPTQVQLREGQIDLVLDIRFPVSKDLAWLKAHILEIAEPLGLRLTAWNGKEPHFIRPDSPLVQSLLAVYREESGDMRPPLAIGGGTYARAIPNAVAFGPVFPGQPRLEHQAEECISIAQLLRLSKIYAAALYALANQDWPANQNTVQE